MNTTPSGAALAAAGPAPEPRASLFLYVKIPVGQGAIDPEHRQENQIDQVLRDHGAGTVIGWGGSLGDPQPDGSRPVAFTRIDIDITGTDLAGARTLLQSALPRLGVPAGSEIHYTLDDRGLRDIYTLSGWLLQQAEPAAPRRAGGGWGV